MSILTPKIEYTLKPSNYDVKPWFLHFTARKSTCPRRFWEIDPEILHTCLMCPCRAFYERGTKKKKKHSWKARQGHVKHECKISESVSKTAWTLDSEGRSWGFICLNQPVRHLLWVRPTRLPDTHCCLKCTTHLFTLRTDHIDHDLLDRL